ncbi:MAG: autotransporter-associated beta strand repeat-containing protein, partial [Kiritimatiellaeota bacterium]|nr:autotransporter-associated beta strand repeat-containing protein [Kiritimatiellota bacterium]
MQVDTAITGTNSWTLETWINIPAPTGTTTTFFSWTYRGGGPDPLGLNGGNNYGPNNRLFEARWNTDAGNAIEHYGGNLTWNGPVPAANQWHHIVMTRDAATRMEYIYLDGVQVQGALMPSVDILPDGIFVVGGTQNGGRNNWEMFVTGYIGQIRVHTGFMPLGDAVLNYAQERAAYGAPGYSIWDNAATTAQPWEDPMNWRMGDIPEANNRVIINNGGGASLTTPVGLVKSLTLTEGALSLSGAAALEVAVASAGVPVVLAGEPGSNFTLDILEGSLTLRDASAGTHMIIGNAAGATGIVNVTGGALPAQLVSGRNILMAAVPDSAAYLTIGADGSLTHTETDGWVVVGHGGYGKVTVNGGSIKYQRVGLVHHGGTGILELNGGEVIMPGAFVFSDGTAFTDSQAIAYLNGGLLQIGERLAVNNPAATNVVYFNGGTVRYGGAANRGDFMAGLSGAYIQAGGAVFDIPNVNDTWVGINQAFEPDPALGGGPDGGLTKRGEGLLILGGANTFSGDIAVEEGFLWFNLDALTNCTGTIRMDSPDVGVGLETGGHAQDLIDRIATDAVGQVMLFPENAGDSFDFSNHPGLALGAAHRNVTFTGTLTPYSADHCYTFTPYSNGSITFNETIADGASVLLNGIGTGTLTLGGNNTYTNGTVISGGKLVMAHPNALGAEGGITIRNGGALKLQAAGIDTAALLARVTPDSRGYILLGTAYADLDLDMRGYPDLYVGTDETTLAYSGTITPDNDVYRLGGGYTGFRGSGNQGFVVTNLTDGASTVRRVVIDGTGVVHIRGASTTYSGGLTVTNGGVL